jgi:Fe-S oxidoreductase
MELSSPFPEVTAAIIAVAGDSLKVCMQCGTCTGACPWNLVTQFSPRHMIRLAQFGLEGLESRDLWNCVTCNACVLRCPRGVNNIDVIRSMRSLMAEMGLMPPSLKAPLGSLAGLGNPWGGAREARAQWASGLDVPAFSRDQEVLYFPCCTPAYEPRNQRAARATASLLQEAGVSFGILGEEENCCGDAVRKLGDEALFERLAGANIKVMHERGVGKILAGSPHCYNAFSKDYPELGGDFQVLHTTQFLNRLLDEGRLQPRRELRLRVTYHDSCYLGRHNNIYEEPRRILAAIPGLDLVEMPRNRENSLCCGGGGGGIWMEVPVRERFSILRVEEALNTGAQVLAAACPYCVVMFEDAVKAMGKTREIRVKEVSELLLDSVKGSPEA